jgi:hypothetical protein
MKTRLFLIIVLMVLSVGCATAKQVVVNEGDDVVRLIGRDIERLASEYGDDVVRTSQEYADDVGRETQYSDEAVQYWDDVLRSSSSQTVEKSTSVLLYRDRNLSPLQANLVNRLRENSILTDEEALLFLQTVCSIADYVQYYNDYPDTSATQFYVEQVAAENGILVFQIADFTDSAITYTTSLINGTHTYSQQEGARIIFEGLCLVSDVANK